MSEINFESRTDFSELHQLVENIKQEISKVIVGQPELIEQIIVAILANGHILIEGVPGVGKTLSANMLAKTIHAKFKRIQLSPV